MGDHDELTRRVLEALGNPCPVCARAVVIVLENPYDRDILDRAATEQDTSREVLERLMQKHGFPPLHQLKNWLRLLTIMYTWKRKRTPLDRQAFESRHDPPAFRRIIRHVTNSTWAVARTAGFDHWLEEFRNGVGVHVDCRTG